MNVILFPHSYRKKWFSELNCWAPSLSAHTLFAGKMIKYVLYTLAFCIVAEDLAQSSGWWEWPMYFSCILICSRRASEHHDCQYRHRARCQAICNLSTSSTYMKTTRTTKPILHAKGQPASRNSRLLSFAQVGCPGFWFRLGHSVLSMYVTFVYRADAFSSLPHTPFSLFCSIWCVVGRNFKIKYS